VVRPYDDRRGKTLIELLAVLGVIALMVSMFLTGAWMVLNAVRNLGL
jgi:prepilin-type N-terminal cleavage/methylation domain-containing protein